MNSVSPLSEEVPSTSLSTLPVPHRVSKWPCTSSSLRESPQVTPLHVSGTDTLATVAELSSLSVWEPR